MVQKQHMVHTIQKIPTTNHVGESGVGILLNWASPTCGFWVKNVWFYSYSPPPPAGQLVACSNQIAAIALSQDMHIERSMLAANVGWSVCVCRVIGVCIWDGIWVESSLSAILAQTEVVAGLHMQHPCSIITPDVCSQLSENTRSSAMGEVCQTDKERNTTTPFQPPCEWIHNTRTEKEIWWEYLKTTRYLFVVCRDSGIVNFIWC